MIDFDNNKPCDNGESLLEIKRRYSQGNQFNLPGTPIDNVIRRMLSWGDDVSTHRTDILDNSTFFNMDTLRQFLTELHYCIPTDDSSSMYQQSPTDVDYLIDDANNNLTTQSPITTVSSQTQKGYCFWPKNLEGGIASKSPPPTNDTINIRDGHIYKCLYEDDIKRIYQTEEGATCKNGTLMIDNLKPKDWKSKWNRHCTNKYTSTKSRPKECLGGKKFAFVNKIIKNPLWM